MPSSSSSLMFVSYQSVYCSVSQSQSVSQSHRPIKAWNLVDCLKIVVSQSQRSVAWKLLIVSMPFLNVNLNLNHDLLIDLDLDL